MPGCSIRRSARSRWPTTPTISSSSTNRRTPGSTADCSPTAGRTRRSRRTTASRPPRNSRSRPSADALTPELEAARIPLNAWGAVGRENEKTEDYAYAATLALARAIAERAGADGLRAVWADAAGKVGAYQPVVTGNASTSGAAGGGGRARDRRPAPDWRALLDLLEERTGVSYDDLWRTWVARDTDLPLLDARRAARTEYDKVVEEAGDWLLPRALRDAMRAWRFDQAKTMLGDATTVLDERAQITTDAAAAGLTVPDTLRTAFESPDGFASATVEANAELAAIRGYTSAVEARRTAADSIEALGLWGLNPDGDLDRARTLFAAGDVAGSAAAAGAAAVGLDRRRRGSGGPG